MPRARDGIASWKTGEGIATAVGGGILTMILAAAAGIMGAAAAGVMAGAGARATDRRRVMRISPLVRRYRRL